MALPPRFSDKDRFTSSRPDIVLVTPISAKTRRKQTTAGGWVLRSSRGQLRETRSSPAAPPATSRATNPRQHRPKDLSKSRRDIHLVEVKYCKDTHQTSEPAERRKGTAQRSLQYSPRSLRYSPHHPFGCGWHHLQHSHSEAFHRKWVLIIKELRILPSSSMCTLWTSLLNLSIPDVPFQYCYILSSGAGFRPSLQPLNPHWFFLSFSRWRSFTVLGTKVAPFP